MTRHARTPDDGPGCDCQAWTRRRSLAAATALAATGLAGCGGDQQATGTPAPLALGGGKQCDVCGMVIAEHPGPSAITFFADNHPEAHEGPAWFDSVKERFVYVRGKRELGWEPTATYVTDYSAVDYDLEAAGEGYLVSRYVTPSSFVAAGEVVYVAGSDVRGAMGPELLPFSSRNDAAAFRDGHGGWLVAHGDVDGEMLRRLRGSEDD